jgi:hypothetical protein
MILQHCERYKSGGLQLQLFFRHQFIGKVGVCDVFKALQGWRG